ncbi:MAG: peptidase M23 [Methylococcales bacterium]|nr:peptidase M23 [Methylococcales bacterium]
MNEKQLVFCLLLSLSINKGRAELSEKNSELNETQVAIDVAKHAIQRIELKKIDLHSRLAEVEKRYGETAAILKTLQAQIEQARQNLGKNQQDRILYQAEIDKQSKELAAQIKAAYAMGRKEKLKVLLNQQDPVLSSRMMLYYDYLNKARLKKLSDIKSIIQRQGQLDKQKDTETAQLEKSLEQKQTEQAVFDEVKKQRNLLLKQLLRDFSSHQQQLKDLKESENKLRGLIRQLQDEKDALASQPEPQNEPTTATVNSTPPIDSDFIALKNQLPWPVNGAVHKFGSARAKGVWDGVLINADEGVEVKAVARGKVAYADPLQGYGSLIIIDHGQGYMTVHGFNQSLYKKMGDLVEAGDVIASVGKSGGRKQSGLYFAIRKQGLPIDPLEWCIKQTTLK